MSLCHCGHSRNLHKLNPSGHKACVIVDCICAEFHKEPSK